VARGFKRKSDRYVAKLDPVERGLVVGLMEQVRDLVAPAPSPDSGSGDAEFESIIAGLGGVGLGVSLSAEDQEQPPSPDPGEDFPAEDFPAGSDDRGPARDPALDRLLPPANREDAQAAAEFRSLTEETLRTRKADNLSTSIAALQGVVDQKVVLDREQALAMLVALTDVRLVLGERLGLKTDDDVETLGRLVMGLDEDDPAVYAMAVYEFLTYLQETLVGALSS
jgi:hypothetical protein